MWNLFINSLPLKDIGLARPDDFHTPFIFIAKTGDVSLKLTGTHCKQHKNMSTLAASYYQLFQILSAKKSNTAYSWIVLLK